MVYLSLSKVLTVAKGLLAVLSNTAAAPNTNFDPGRIYFPDDLDEVRRAAAFQQCQNDPNCKTGLFFAGIPGACSATRDSNNVSQRHRTNVRTSSGGCNPFAGEVVWPLTGECVELLTQGPCPNGYWVKLNINDLQPHCSPMPCEVGQALYGRRNTCLLLTDSTVCPPGQFLLNNEYGIAECDCEPGKAFHGPTNACYRVYSQGPCPPGQIFKVLDSLGRSTAGCIPNPCQKENMVMLNSQCQVLDNSVSEIQNKGTCYQIGTEGPCKTGILFIDGTLLEPMCILETTTNAIITVNTPTDCPLGEMTDIKGNCRVPYRLSNTRRCQRGSIRDQRQRCRNNLSIPSAEGNTECPQDLVLFGGACFRVQIQG